jgi:pheromone shutdown-related protein TraB
LRTENLNTEKEINQKYGDDVVVLEKKGRTFYLVGTAHISKKSADLVKEVIENEQPDSVAIELDEQRYQALSKQKRWEELDLKQIIKEKQLSTLLINIVLSSYQKKLGEKLGVTPGLEMLEAVNVCKEHDYPIVLADRNVRTTLKRSWHSMSFWQKMKFIFSGFAGIFEKQELTEEKLEELKNKDVMTELLEELGKAMPVLKTVLIDERDKYLAQKIEKAEGEKVVAIVGAGHLAGIRKSIEADKEHDLAEFEVIPPPSKLTKWFGWGIPAIIIASILYIGYTQGLAEAGDNALIWILANGIPSAFGTILALAHPFTVIATFLAAPLTSLTPVIGAGYVSAFVQAYFQPPVVKEFKTVTDDVNKVTKWWSNKLLRILLVFILAGIGSALGTYFGAYKIISNLIQ